jgi:GNAT superfamily N-acetyltransferase
MIIRAAIFEDLEGLLNLGDIMKDESPVSFPTLDVGQAGKSLGMAIDHPNSSLVMIAEDKGIIGMVTGYVGPYAFSNELRSCCDLLFVIPERRGAVAAKMLMGAFIDWSRNVGAKIAFAGVSTDVHPERTGALFERVGFSPAGLSYKMELG